MAKITVEHIDEEQQDPETVTEASAEGTKIHAPRARRAAHSSRRVFPWLLTVLVVLVCIAYLSNHQSRTKGSPVSTQAKQNVPQLSEAEQLHQKLSRTLDLPLETPNLATVQDAQKVKGQLFFQKAQNGDKVLIYVKAGQAVLYRPSTGKVINLAPIALDTKSSQGVR